MNSPPESIALSSQSLASSDQKQDSSSRSQPSSSAPHMDEEGGSSSAGHRRFGPPSPASSGSAIAVGTSHEAALIQSIEKGEYQPSNGDDTHSLTDSIRQHIVDGGLRYHAYHAGQYAFPNDEAEQAREDMKHNLTVYLCDGEYFLAPIRDQLEKGAEILDLGTGTGKWCIELADLYPESEFHGMDLSPIQPDWVPENALFLVDDIEHEGGWTYPENKFDYIHIRHTIHSIRNRQQLWDRIYKHLKPGGYLEVQEFHYTPLSDDNSCDEPYALRDFMRYLGEGLTALGSDLYGILHVEEEMKEAGFKDVRSVNIKAPIGPWPRRRRLQECGHVLRDVIMFGLVGLSRRPFRDGLNWTMVQIEMFLIDVRKSISEEVNGLPKYHSYFPFYSVYGRKPLDAA